MYAIKKGPCVIVTMQHTHTHIHTKYISQMFIQVRLQVCDRSYSGNESHGLLFGGSREVKERAGPKDSVST